MYTLDTAKRDSTFTERKKQTGFTRGFLSCLQLSV